MIRKEIRQKIIRQSILEIDWARKYKERVLPNWRRNDLFYSGKKTEVSGMSNINIVSVKTKSFVNTLLSKVDTAPHIKFSAVEQADIIKARRANSLIELDSSPANGDWNFKDLLVKKQAIKYGRGIFEYHADSINGYQSHLSIVNPYDFLIDPMAGGVNIENAKYLGRTGIIKNRKEIEKNKLYIKSEVKELINHEINEETKEEKEKRNRFYIFAGSSKKMPKEDEWTFFEWYTTYKGERYYLLLHEPTQIALRVEKLKDIFKSELWPFATYATDPDDAEFWTSAPLDNVIELFMGQHVLVNQQIDNSEKINNPMKAFNTEAIKDPATLNWRKNGNIPVKDGYDINRVFQVYRPDYLRNNIDTYNLLDRIGQTESGVTADMKGLSEEDKVGIYEGNLSNAADRLGLLNKSYSNCYSRLGLLYYNGLKEHLNEKVAINMIGSDGLQFEEITKEKIIPSGKEFDVVVKSADIELNADTVDKRNKIQFLGNYRGDPTKNQDALFELEAQLVGLSTDEIKKIQDTNQFGDSETLSQAAADFEIFLTGGDIEKPNPVANTAYKQYFVDELSEQGKHIKPEIQVKIINYIASLEETIIKNTIKKAKAEIAKQQSKELANPNNNQNNNK